MDQFDALDRLISDSPSDRAQLAIIRRSFNEWRLMAADEIARYLAANDAQAPADENLRFGHDAVDSLRGAPALNARSEYPRPFSNGSTRASISRTGKRTVARP